MAGGIYFLKVDLNMAYPQIELYLDSREMTTFATLDRLYQYKKIYVGVNMVSEKFQQL